MRYGGIGIRVRAAQIELCEGRRILGVAAVAVRMMVWAGGALGMGNHSCAQQRLVEDRTVCRGRAAQGRQDSQSPGGAEGGHVVAVDVHHGEDTRRPILLLGERL